MELFESKVVKAAIADAKAGLLKFLAKAVDKAMQVAFNFSAEQVQAAKTACISEDGKLEVLANSRYDAVTGIAKFTTTHFSKYAAVSIDVSFKDITSVTWAMAALHQIKRLAVHKQLSFYISCCKNLRNNIYVFQIEMS